MPAPPAVFSAHGVPKSGRSKESENDPDRRNPPLVKKVHADVERHKNNGKVVVLIGHLVTLRL